MFSHWLFVRALSGGATESGFARVCPYLVALMKGVAFLLFQFGSPQHRNPSPSYPVDLRLLIQTGCAGGVRRGEKAAKKREKIGLEGFQPELIGHWADLQSFGTLQAPLVPVQLSKTSPSQTIAHARRRMLKKNLTLQQSQFET